MAKPLSFEDRIAKYQRPGDGTYLLSQWDKYAMGRYRELCGLVLALASMAPAPPAGARRKIRIVDYGCASGTVFRALEHYLGSVLDFSFTGIDVDRRALGFVRAKWPYAELHEADGIRLQEMATDGTMSADIAVVFSRFSAMDEDEVRRIVGALSRIAPVLIVADLIDNASGAKGAVLELQDVYARPYQAMCHAFTRIVADAGYRETVVLPTRDAFKRMTGFIVAGTGSLAPHEAFTAFLERGRSGTLVEPTGKRPEPATSAPSPPRVNSVSTSTADVVKEIQRKGFRSVAVLADRQCADEVRAALDEAGASTVTTDWYSGQFADVERGALVLDQTALRFDCVVVGGAFAHLYHPRLLRMMSRHHTVRPVLVAARNWEFCLGQISFPGAIDRARAYLFNHFHEYFAIRDPILARLEAYDQRTTVEWWRLFEPGESVEIDLDTILPGRQGPAVISVYTCAPVLTRGRHFRWRFCVDAEWEGSLATLHGTHDIPHASATTEFIQSRTSFGSGRIVFTLPNHYDDMGDRGIDVECVDGTRHFHVNRERTKRIEEVELPLNNNAPPAFGDYVGCRFGQYTTPYWFGFDEGQDRRTLAANHTQGHAFAFLTKAPPDVPVGDLERSLLQHDIVTWPYCVPVLSERSGLELGLSFDSSWPVLRQMTLRFFDLKGRLVNCRRWTKDRPGIVYADELVAVQREVPRESIGVVLVSPDWEGMNLDQQQNGISPLVDFALRHRTTGDYDITEFQNSWRNLGVVVEQMPHWIHFSNHLVGGTNLYGRALARDGWRVGALLVNGSGNLKHDVEIDYTMKVFDRVGRSREAAGSLKPFTHALVWLDEVLPDLRTHLGEGGYGAIVIRSRNGDLNGQLVTVKDDRAVSFQHMWGY